MRTICSPIFSNRLPAGVGKNRGLAHRYQDRNKFAVLEIIVLLPAYALPRVYRRNTSRHSLEDDLACWISSSDVKRELDVAIELLSAANYFS